MRKFQVPWISNKDVSEIQKSRNEGIGLLKNKIKVKSSHHRTGARSNFQQACGSKHLLLITKGNRGLSEGMEMILTDVGD